MAHFVSRYDLACDMFTYLCYLYDHGCVCTLEHRWIHIYPFRSSAAYPDSMVRLAGLQVIINQCAERWKADMIEVEE